MKNKTHFAFRVDIWDDTGNSIVEHVAGVEDYQAALATYRAACERWPGTPITLRLRTAAACQPVMSLSPSDKIDCAKRGRTT
jgi:hypothetical protein